MIELWKEIEMEYNNSEIQGFTTVKVNYQNLEKRGDGRRMVFHCQGIITNEIFYLVRCFLYNY